VAIGRLRPGVSLEAATSELERIARAHQSDKPAWMAQAEANSRVVVTPLARALVGDLRPALLTLLGAVGLVLLIACANVANLQLSRFHGRIRELGVRAALGASKFQLIRLVLAECLLLSATGAAAGFAGAYFLVKFARHDSAMLHLSDPAMVKLNGTVALFSLALTLVCAVLFGVGPMLLVIRAGEQKALRIDHARAASGLRNVFRGVLMMAEVALAVILLLGAGLLLRSFARLTAVEPGFETRGVLTASMTLPGSRYRNARQESEFVRELMRRITTAPGLIAAGAASSPPFVNYNTSMRIYFEGQPDPPFGQTAAVIAITPEYFRSLEIPMIAGRNFSDSDTADAPRVTIINVAFAQKYFANEIPLGRRFHLGPQDPVAIVGVVANSQHEDLAKPASPEIFESYDQFPQPRLTVTLRAAVPPQTLVNFVRAQVSAIDRDEPVYDVSTMESRVNKTLHDRRVETFLLGAFAALALALATAGVYGVMSYAVAQSRREIGVRIALGATPAGITSEVLKRALTLSSFGVFIGLGGAWYFTRFLTGFLFGVGAKDPATFAGGAALLIFVSLLASFLPARRAARVDPVEALRAE
jgi:putative ABC transport system permease protein